MIRVAKNLKEIKSLLLTLDESFHILLASQFWKTRFGIEPSMLESKSILEFVAESAKKNLLNAIQQSQSENSAANTPVFKPFSCVFHLPNQNLKHLEVLPSFHDGIYVCFFNDLTESIHQAELLDKVQLTTKTGGWEINIADRTTRWTAETYIIHELEPDTSTDVANGLLYFEVGDREKIANQVEKCIQEGIAFDGEYHFRTAKNNSRWVRVAARPEYEDEKIIRVYGIIQDITDFVLLKEESRKTSKHLESVANNFPGTLYIFKASKAGEFSAPYFSDKCFDIFGYTAQQLKDDINLILDSVHPNDIQALMNSIEASRQSLNDFFWEGRFQHADGRYRWVSASSRPEATQNGEVIWYGSMYDITAAKELDQKLQDQQLMLLSARKYSALGEMVGAIAHEINTPLTTLSLSTAQLLTQADLPVLNVSRIKELALRIDRTIQRLSGIVQSVRTLSRREDAAGASATSLKKLLEEALVLCEHDLRMHQIAVDIQFNCDQETYILCRPTQALQILVNLIKNAIDANEQRPQSWIRIEIKKAQRNCEIFVTDSGPGIEPKVAENIMQPYFTTKPIGKGTGLGLSLAVEFAKANQGDLVYCSEFQHTTFRLTLPLTEMI